MTARRSALHRLARQLKIAADPGRPNRARHRASRYAASLAERLGMITRPPACEWCRRRLPLERHHWDHAEPLVVHWLCGPCHEIADRMDLGSQAESA